jgi:zinc transport system substrate-binding protein
MEKVRVFGVAAALILVFAAGIFASSYFFQLEEQMDSRIGVIATLLPQANFVEKVGGDKVDVTVMVLPGGSPHTYEPTSNQMVKVSEAKIYAKVGSGVEFELKWMEKIVEQNKRILVVDCSSGITKLGNDPHIWNSPINAKKIAENICAGLIEVDPDNEDYYLENMNIYLQELDDVDDYIHQTLGEFTNRVFMIYHPAFGYFADEYNLTQLAIQHEGKPPTPQVIQDCIDLARQYNLSYIFVAPQYAKEHAETIAQEIGAQTIFMDPLPQNYISNMKSVAASLALELEQ